MLDDFMAAWEDHPSPAASEDSRMCDCIKDWVPDPEAVGDHKMIPYRCSDYIADLEKIVGDLMRTQERSLSVLGELVKTRDRVQLADLARRGDEQALAQLSPDSD